MKKVFAGIVIGITMGILVMMAVNLTNDVKADNPEISACDQAADGTAYVIESNEIVDTFKTKECEK